MSRNPRGWCTAISASPDYFDGDELRFGEFDLLGDPLPWKLTWRLGDEGDLLLHSLIK